VLAIINRSKEGVDSATLAEKTGFDKKKIANIVFKLRKLGKVKSVGRGVYVKV
jgi:DNA-binding IscR family transcriptional regulator